jgi:hypothetical protein
MRAGIRELRAAVVAAEQIEKAIKQKYPSYRGWLVLSTPCGQVEAGASVEEILKTFPAMILDDAHKAECREIRAAIERLEAEADTVREPSPQAAAKAKLEELRRRLTVTAQELEFDPAVQVEIRFKELKYEEVVWPLQQDPLVDRLRTPQTRASIRIVIGTIGELASK